ncbi:hypothetical protein K438DRAFT_2071667 [Mycena galopus ATCC 62051]|nr:hypothetical protein K438DRAFT_2071667 [Mycena galopus ATCC 62051]
MSTPNPPVNLDLDVATCEATRSRRRSRAHSGPEGDTGAAIKFLLLIQSNPPAEAAETAAASAEIMVKEAAVKEAEAATAKAASPFIFGGFNLPSALRFDPFAGLFLSYASYITPISGFALPHLLQPFPAEAKASAAPAAPAATEAAALEKAKATYEAEAVHLTKLAAQKRDDAIKKAGEELTKAVTTTSIIRRREEASAQTARAKADEAATKATEKEAAAAFAKAAKLATAERVKAEKAAEKARQAAIRRSANNLKAGEPEGDLQPPSSLEWLESFISLPPEVQGPK